MINGLEASFYTKDYEQLHYLSQIIKNKEIDETILLGHLLNILKQGDVAYDIGANIGIHTIFMAKKVGSSGQVYAFEPETTTAKMLDDNLKLNNLSNAIVFRNALGDRLQEGELYINDKIGRGSLSLIKTDGKRVFQKTTIVPGDDLVQKENLPIPKVVKIDVEGYELAVLSGLEKTLTRKECIFLYCEIHPTLLPAGQSQDNVMELANRLGFSPIQIYHRGQEIHAIFEK